MEDNQRLINDDSSGSAASSVHSAVKIDSVSVKFDESIRYKSTEEIHAALSNFISEDMLAADAKWNVFIAACQSYRYDSCLKPYPPMFFDDDNEKDINRLLSVIDETPSFPLLKKILSNTDKIKLNDDVGRLLYWVLVQGHEPALKTVPKEKFSEVLNLVPCELSAQKPDYIFHLIYPENSPGNIKWRNYKCDYKTMYAYHGSRLENFHSIIHYGLQMSLTKTPLFGQGVYLSSELLVSLPYSSTGFGWGKSLMGAELSIVALCEVLDHPSTHCQVKGTSNKSRAMASESLAGEVPHKYYVVANSELIRIQYLLVYARTPPPLEAEPAGRSDTLLGWINEHKLLTAIMGYVFLLASVGLSNNHHVLRYYKMFLNKAGMQ